jgi:hypothetical protein
MKPQVGEGLFPPWPRTVPVPKQQIHDSECPCEDCRAAFRLALHASRRCRCEITDLYFWLGADAEIVGFTPWQTAWVAEP